MLVLVLGASFAAGAAANSGVPVRASVTGEIRQLDPHVVVVGRFRCAIPPKLVMRAGGFVIGDPVRIECARGWLESIGYRPEVATAQSSRTGGGNAPTVVPAQPAASSCGPACSSSSGYYSISMVSLGSGPAVDSSSLTAAIADISDTTISVGSLTCSYRPTIAAAVARLPHVGDPAPISPFASAGAVSSGGWRRMGTYVR